MRCDKRLWRLRRTILPEQSRQRGAKFLRISPDKINPPPLPDGRLFEGLSRLPLRCIHVPLTQYPATPRIIQCSLWIDD